MFGQKKVAMLVAEFFGAATLSLAVFAMIGRTDFPFFSGIAAAAVVGVLTLLLSTASPAHFNPAVTFGMWTIRKIRTLDGLAFIAAQMLGGLAAWRLAVYLIHSNLKNSAVGAFNWRVAVAEGIGTVIFTFGFAAAVYEKLEGARLAAAIGLSLMIGILAASLASNGILNPAVALGVQSWSKAYVVSPLVGAFVGFNLYNLIFVARPARVRVPARAAATTNAPKRRTTTRKTTARRKRS